ncbi:MAG: ABC transporter substrate-binding protein [Actinomycetota bacterium]|nr:ABC transporter substrate-binding protein [Actinomycetota bacterium]
MNASTRKRNTKAAALVAGLSAAMLLAACSSSNPSAIDSTVSPSGLECSAVPGVSATQVKVGIVFPNSGAAAPTFAEFDKAAQLRFEQENAKGGVNGRQIVTTVYDDMSDGSRQSTVATKAIDQDQMYGLLHASQADTMFTMLHEKNVPVVGLAIQPAYSVDPNVFGVFGVYNSGFASTSTPLRMKEAGSTSVAIVGHNSPGATASAKGMEVAVPEVGMKVGTTILDMPFGAFDATSMALKIKNSGADGVDSISLVDSAISLLQALDQQGVPMKAKMMSLIVPPDVVAKTGNVLEGVLAATSGTKPLTLDDPAVTAYVDAMNAAGLNTETSFASVGYVAADLFIRGLQEAGPCAYRADFVTNLRAVTNYDGAGLSIAPVSFAPGLTPNGDPSKCQWFLEVKHGKFVPDPAATCGDLIPLS